MQLTKITWIDATGADGWIEEKVLINEVPIIHHSVGYIVKETEGYITVTMSYDEKKESLGAWLLIPKIFITKRENI